MLGYLACKPNKAAEVECPQPRMYNIHYRFVANSMIQVLYRTFRNLNMLRVSVTMARSKSFDVLYRFIRALYRSYGTALFRNSGH